MSTVTVKLKRSWFGPDSVRYKVHGGDNTHVLDSDVAALAPSDAKFFDASGKEVSRPTAAGPVAKVGNATRAPMVSSTTKKKPAPVVKSSDDDAE
jgi:hypothetical protein